MSRRVYKNPPIQEAVCEFFFSQHPAYDPMRIGRFYERIRDLFDGPPKSEAVQQTGIGVSGEPVIVGNLSRYRFPSQDGRFVAVINSASFSVHALAPYEGWMEAFRPRIERALQAFDIESGGLTYRQILVRFINRIELMNNSTENIGEFFDPAPLVPDSPKLSVLSTLNQFSAITESGRELVQSTFGVQPQSERLAIILDIVVSNQVASEILDYEAAVARTDELRGLEREVFEGSITDRAREKFDE